MSFAHWNMRSDKCKTPRYASAQPVSNWVGLVVLAVCMLGGAAHAQPVSGSVESGLQTLAQDIAGKITSQGPYPRRNLALSQC